jgi:hypothetical protein
LNDRFNGKRRLLFAKREFQEMKSSNVIHKILLIRTAAKEG